MTEYTIFTVTCGIFDDQVYRVVLLTVDSENGRLVTGTLRIYCLMANL